MVEKQNMSEENELGDAEKIHQTSDEHVTVSVSISQCSTASSICNICNKDHFIQERSCEIEMQVIKEDISTEDVYNLVCILPFPYHINQL